MSGASVADGGRKEKGPEEHAEVIVAIKRMEVTQQAVMGELQRVAKKVDYLYKKFKVGERETVRSKFPLKNLSDWDEVIQMLDREDPNSPEVTQMVTRIF